MTPLRFVDENSRPKATRPCRRCRRPTPVGYSYRLEHLRMIDWQLFAEAQIVQWCGDAQNFVVVPHAAGERAALVPILGEAA